MTFTTSTKSVPGKTVPGKSIPKKSPLVLSSPPPTSLTSFTTPGSPTDNVFRSPSKRKLNASNEQYLPSPTESIESYQNIPSCAHLTKVLDSNAKEAVLKTYTAAMKIVLVGLNAAHNGETFSSRTNSLGYFNSKGEKINVRSLQKLRLKLLKCNECTQSQYQHHNVLYMCLQCTNVACTRENHAYNHAKNSSHIFGVNPDNGELICFKCGDIVSHPLIERIRYNSLKTSGLLKFTGGILQLNDEHSEKNYKLIQNSSRLPSYKESTGLRGFINLGSTCFMSSVLQTLIHNPFLKSYYLSDSHADCPKSESDCMSCCLSSIYQDFFTNPAISGFGLTTFIEAAWKVKRTLAGYSEQDAHEFWQFLIHQIHKNDTKSSRYIKNKESTPAFENGGSGRVTSQNCDCVIHKTFSGTLDSTLTCTVCGEERTIEDPMLDVSLEIQDHDPTTGHKYSLEDLHSCFKKYTRVEELDVLYECNSCNKRTKVTKRLHLKKLPPVLSIQLKRFEHFGVSSKIDYHIDVPHILDMKDYVSAASYPHQVTKYELFSIVCHLGNVNTGHYLAYVKNSNGIWFKFDDAVITRISEADVKKVNGYMLFYCIRGDS